MSEHCNWHALKVFCTAGLKMPEMLWVIKISSPILTAYQHYALSSKTVLCVKKIFTGRGMQHILWLVQLWQRGTI
ncbi:hypothetical protein NL54_21905 [Pantoea stewartii]|nr:hypothetical protein NL54_21905 [Pantoea stewartii]KHN65643.1 hypothetical protein OI73_00285 [Pantoea stewartii]